MTDEERKAKLATLASLLAMAEGKANKAEAMNAIDMLQARAEKFGFTMEEIRNGLASRDDNFKTASMYSGEKQYGFVDQFLWKTIANFCNVLVGVGVDGDGDLTLRYFGTDADVELAKWLRATIKAAMALEWGVYRDFVMAKGVNVKVEMQSFHRGLADEMRERMDVQREKVSSGRNEIIVATMALVVQKARDAGFAEAVSGRGRSMAMSEGAYGAGRQAGARVNIGRGVAGGGAKMIGNY